MYDTDTGLFNRNQARDIKLRAKQENKAEAEIIRELLDRWRMAGSTDCLVMAVADQYGTRDIFGFDQQFEDAGYIRLMPSV